MALLPRTRLTRPSDFVTVNLFCPGTAYAASGALFLVLLGPILAPEHRRSA